MRYIEKANKLIKDYFKILSPDFPEWLNEYIETARMQKQKYISVTCGKIYSKLFDYDDYSSLDHSIAVALIIWNFTHDKKQTLSGLFHDIATPAFKHCIDFLNGDYMNQESTEEPKDIYYVKYDAKIRYIDPLFNGKRMSKECKFAQKMIEKNLSYNMDNYVFMDKRLNILMN